MKAAIVIDSWKLPIFERHLEKAGYTYKQHPGVTDDTLTLAVEMHYVDNLGAVVRAANAEAASMSGTKTEVTQ